MDNGPLEFAIPRVVAALIDVEHIPNRARGAGVRDLRFAYRIVGQVVYVTCSRDLAVNVLENLQRRMRSSVLPLTYLPEYMDAVARIQHALGVGVQSNSDT